MLVVDDAAIDRQGVAVLVGGEPDLEVCAQVETAEHAVELPVKPDVIVLGLVTYRESDITPVETLKARFPDAAIVVLAHIIDLAAVRTALAAGVAGCASKSASTSEVVQAVRSVAQGEHYLDPGIGAALVSNRLSDRAGPPIAGLTQAETEVLRHLALGYTNAETADLLSNSLRTIESHRASIQRKLDCHTRAQLVRVALDSGLIASHDQT